HAKRAPAPRRRRRLQDSRPAPQTAVHLGNARRLPLHRSRADPRCRPDRLATGLSDQPTGRLLRPLFGRSSVLTRITVAGALFLGVVAVLPFFVRTVTGIQSLTISSTAVLIVVGVALDTMRQLEAQ